MGRTFAVVLVFSWVSGCDNRTVQLGIQSNPGGGAGGGGAAVDAGGGAGGGSPMADGGTCAPTTVKLMVLLDQSGSMCVTDPPGGQPVGGFCQQIPPPLGVTEPARLRALKKWFTALAAQPNVSVALVPFETNVVNAFPVNPGFVSAGAPGLNTAIDNLQSTLGKGTDYEGALAHAVTAIGADIAAMKTTDAGVGQLANTRYVVLLISDGSPFPRCSANDALTNYADSTMPGGIWPDSLGAGSFCNDADAGTSEIVGFVPGSDRNQTAALKAKVDQLMAFTAQGVGSVSFNTQLLFNAQRVAACGPICQDVYGVFPEVAPSLNPQAALTVARYTLGQLSQRGGGTYAEALDDFGIGTLPNTLPGFALTPGCP